MREKIEIHLKLKRDNTARKKTGEPLQSGTEGEKETREINELLDLRHMFMRGLSLL